MPRTPAPGGHSTSDDRRRWVALVVVCAAMLMNTLDGSVVNVALPSIAADLGFSQAGLAWVTDSYLITFGSFLLMAGRIGDLVGRKKVFLSGVVLFVLSSMACGLADSQALLIAARFVQGAAAAVSSSVIIAIIVTEFTDPAERVKAMSMYIFVAVGGGSVGLLAGGVLTQVLDWHWVFFINLPIGIATIVAGHRLLAESPGIGIRQGVDVLGSVLVTAALMVGIYGIITAHEHGWASLHTVGLVGGATLLLATFFLLESRIANPIMPLRILRTPNLVASSVIRGFSATGMYSTFFLGALYMERIQGFDSMQIGLAFLPMTLTTAVLSAGLAARLIGRFGERNVLLVGLALSVASLSTFARMGVGTDYFPSLFIALVLLGFGAGSSFMTLLSIAMKDVPKSDAGLASGIVNVSMQMFAAIGLAILGTVAARRSEDAVASGATAADALVSGYHAAFGLAAVSMVVGLVLATVLLRRPKPAAVEVEVETGLLERAEQGA